MVILIVEGPNSERSMPVLSHQIEECRHNCQAQKREMRINFFKHGSSIVGHTTLNRTPTNGKGAAALFRKQSITYLFLAMR